MRDDPDLVQNQNTHVPPTTGHLLVLWGPPISHGLPSCLQIRIITPPVGYGGVFSKSVLSIFLQDDPDMIQNQNHHVPHTTGQLLVLWGPLTPTGCHDCSKHVFHTSRVVPPRALKIGFEIFLRDDPDLVQNQNTHVPLTTGHLLVLWGPPISHGLPSYLQIRISHLPRDSNVYDAYIISRTSPSVQYPPPK